MKITLITTTINVPTLLTDYVKAAKGHDVTFIVAGDLKTPPEARTFCEGLGIEYMGQDEQEAYLAPYPELKAYLPWNSVQRRNVAILKAYKDGADVIVTIDDDNFCAEEDYFKAFGDMGQITNLSLSSNIEGWLNCCERLQDKNQRKFFPRGYPLDFRKSDCSGADDWRNTETRQMVVGGLWLGEPDIDAITRMAVPVNVTNLEPLSSDIHLDAGTWCPFNSQNTALHRDVIPAYFLSPHIGRFDDIWASYVVQRLTQENGDCISFGRPLVRQDRNPHDLFKDLELEMFGMRHTDDFCEQLRAARITQNGYKAGCLELLDQIKGEQYAEFIRGYRIWLNLF